MKSFACGDVVPGCDALFTGATDEEVLGHVARHAADAHGMAEVPESVAQQVLANIR